MKKNILFAMMLSLVVMILSHAAHAGPSSNCKFSQQQSSDTVVKKAAVKMIEPPSSTQGDEFKATKTQTAHGAA